MAGSSSQVMLDTDGYPFRLLNISAGKPETVGCPKDSGTHYILTNYR